MPLRKDYLRRLPKCHYQGDAYVHWSLTIEHRRTGWLNPLFYFQYREVLAHTLFRYQITCPIFCCMPDHFHLLWLGTALHSDQLKAMKFFRRHLNTLLRKNGYQLQSQGFDNVLGEEDREREGFETVCEYIARNPERKKLVGEDCFYDYEFTDCLVPGAPDLHFSDDRFWDGFWNWYSHSARF